MGDRNYGVSSLTLNFVLRETLYLNYGVPQKKIYTNKLFYAGHGA